MKDKEKEILDTIMLMSKVMSEDKILDKISETLEKHKVLRTETTKIEFMTYIHLFILKMDINKNGLSKVMNNIHNLSDLQDKIKNSKDN